tara:strand:+ start:2366 stop:2704 length:339 start_codon:yes stop_codon:yes gene_type:complete
MIDTDKYKGHTEGEWVFKHINSNWYQCDKIGEIHMEDIAIKEASANAQLIADAPLLLEEVKRLRERLMLAESALGEVRACHEDGQGNLGEILEHYRDKEGVEMPNAFDEVIE